MNTPTKPTANTRQIGGDHYMNMGVRPWDAMRAWMTPAEFAGFLRGNAIKYLARSGHKGDRREDLAKALHYLEKLLEVTPESPRVTVVRAGPDGGCTHDCNQGRACTCSGR